MLLLDRDRERERRRERYPEYIPQGYAPEYEGPYMGWDAYITSRPERETRPTMTYLDESRHWPMEMRPIGLAGTGPPWAAQMPLCPGIGRWIGWPATGP